ncbi:MAG: hypothetical protein CL912_08560 [Deltaproteobacteria bacterium]|nr:hypothetical protein [Deltaproteobacteria bacterium]
MVDMLHRHEHSMRTSVGMLSLTVLRLINARQAMCFRRRAAKLCIFRDNVYLVAPSTSVMNMVDTGTEKYMKTVCKKAGW